MTTSTARSRQFQFVVVEATTDPGGPINLTAGLVDAAGLARWLRAACAVREADPKSLAEYVKILAAAVGTQPGMAIPGPAPTAAGTRGMSLIVCVAMPTAAEDAADFPAFLDRLRAKNADLAAMAEALGPRPSTPAAVDPVADTVARFLRWLEERKLPPEGADQDGDYVVGTMNPLAGLEPEFLRRFDRFDEAGTKPKNS